MEDGQDGQSQLVLMNVNYFRHSRISNVHVLCGNFVDFSILMFQF